MRMAILHAGFSLDVVGGIAAAVFNIAKGLVAKGHEVHVLTNYAGLPRKQEVEGFYLHHCFRGPRLRYLESLLGVLGSLKRIREIEPDIVLSMETQLTALLAKRFLGIPTIVWGRGTAVTSKSTVVRLLRKPCLKSADVVIALTERMKRDLYKHYSRDIVVIPNGVDVNRFQTLPRDNARQKLGIDRKARIILCVAHLRREKGLEYLVEAMEDISANCPQAILFVIGKDFQKGRIQALASEHNVQQRICFTGVVPYDEVPYYMAAADIFVLPSVAEGFPNVLLEAMATGLPIVATNVGGVPEIINHGENGLLVKPEDSHQLVEVIASLLQNDDMKRAFSLNNIERAKDYSWAAVIDSLERVCLEVRRR